MDPVPYLASGLLARAGFTHAFFTRQGGVSEGPFATLNLSPMVGDRPEQVRENLDRAARTLGLRPEHLYVAAQPHDRGVILLHGAEAADAVARTAADAIVSSAAGVGCGVRSADCVPILLADPETGRVAAVHAGWRGLVRHVIGSATERMCELGSRRGALLAAVGPHIGPEAFEVGEDVANEIASASSAQGVVERRASGKAWVSLARVVRAQLASAGLEEARIEQLPGCTYRDASRFFSYRRDGQRSGRMLALIVPRAADATTTQNEQGTPPRAQGTA
jgi:polyphenol oxidase